MLYGLHTFHCRLESRAILPAYKGSTFRGVFGHALKKVVCTVRQTHCGQCLLKNRCLYVMVFETEIAKPPPEGARIAAIPHPFVIEPPETTQTEFSPDDIFNFNLILFGEANHHLAYFIYAIDTVGKTGIGKKVDGIPGRFLLQSVSRNGLTLYTKEDRQIRMTDAIPRLYLAPNEMSPTQNISKIAIILKTPLRFKFNNQLTSDLPFHMLVRLMLRRADALLRTYGNQPPELDFKGMIRRAEAVETMASDLRWHDWERYSQRQEQKMRLGGLTGQITYQGPLDEFLPLIDFCSKTHIGKQTAFGLGEMKMVLNE